MKAIFLTALIYVKVMIGAIIKPSLGGLNTAWNASGVRHTSLIFWK